MLTEDEVEEGPSLSLLLLTSIRIEHLQQFLSDRDSSFTPRTIVNYSAALQWHLLYLRYLLHPDSLPPTKEDQKNRRAFRSSVVVENDNRLRWLKESWKKLKAIQLQYSPAAERQTRQRNNKDALLQRGQWVEYSWVREIHEAVDVEGWARMKSLQRRLKLIGPITQVYNIFLFIFSFIFIFFYYSWTIQWPSSFFGFVIGCYFPFSWIYHPCGHKTLSWKLLTALNCLVIEQRMPLNFLPPRHAYS